MTRNYEAFFGMMLKVKNFGTKNATAIATIAAATQSFTTLTTLVNSLIAADTGSRADLSGYSIDKENKRNLLESLCLKISNALAALGAINADPILIKRADFPSSYWDRCSEETLITEATILSNLATPTATATALVPLGVVAADITALSTAITNFTNVISDPSLAIDQRHQDNLKINTIIDSVRTHFETKMDLIMRLFETNNPTLYSLYLDARAIDNNGSKKTPTVEMAVPANTLLSIYKTGTYRPERFFTIQNTDDSESVMLSLSNNDHTEGPQPLLLPAGETRQRAASNLAPDGVFVMINNSSNRQVTIKLWIEE